ncbi:MAG: hypothetical protein CVU39_05220 [Chloroflexi bacterium HGW-Chloroflexi-10]|nr:MAG: hypothetical protein CVU39_05220 [Chloroflexi bacterium HGW-Chloroflexi-10]
MAKKIQLGSLMFLFVAILSACNFPGQKTNPTPFFPTPNYTMTALFSMEIPPTITPPAVVVTVVDNNPLPTQTPAAQATNTPVVVTALPTAVATQAAAATNTAITVRGGQWATAKFLSTAPKMDGDWGEWETTKYPAAYVVWGTADRKNEADLEGSYRIGWDSEYLFVAIKVLDDAYVQNASGQNMYKGDSIEILFDTNLYGDLNSNSLSADDFQIGISAGKGSITGEKEAYLWYPSSKAGSLSNVKIASTNEEGAYRVEIAIPWSVFGITPASGQQYGLGISVSDNDKESENLQQSMVSNLPYRSFLNPTTWTVVTLSK